VLVLDIGLPGMDGYELARHLRADPATRSSLFVALSGYAREADRQRSAEAGFDHHFAKPADMPRLLSLVGQWQPPAA